LPTPSAQATWPIETPIAWMGPPSGLRHGVHSYAAEDYALSEDEIREQFSDYLDRFDLWPEGQVG